MVKDLGILFEPSKDSSATLVLWTECSAYFYEGGNVRQWDGVIYKKNYQNFPDRQARQILCKADLIHW